MIEKLSGLHHYQIDLIVALAIFQGMVAGLPEEVIILSMGFLAFQGKVFYWEAFLVIFVCLSAANGLTVFLGNSLGYKILTKKPFCWILKKSVLEAAVANVQKNKEWGIFQTRFTPFIRGPVYWAFGISKVPTLKFMKIDMLAQCLYIPSLLALGSWLGSKSDTMEHFYQNGLVIMQILVGISATILAFRFLRKKIKRSS